MSFPKVFRFAALAALVCIIACDRPTPTPELSTPTRRAPAPELFKVIGIVDGDTIDVLSDEKVTLRVRLNGIDAPERAQPFSNNSRELLSELVFGRRVTITEVDEPDRYGRLIADVHAGEKWVSLELVRAGLAWHYKTYSDDKDLAAAENLARESKLGLWSDPRHVAPWDWRKLSKIERDKLR